MDLSNKQSWFKWTVTVIVLISFLALTITSDNFVKDAYAYSCCPVVKSMNVNVLQELLKRLIMSSIVSRIKAWAAEKIGFEYITGSLIDGVFNANISGMIDSYAGGMSGAVNQVIGGAGLIGGGDVRRAIDNHLNGNTTGSAIDNAVQDAARDFITNQLIQNGVDPSTVANLDTVVNDYAQSMVDSGPMNQINDAIQEYANQLEQTMNQAAQDSASIARLGSLLDLSESILNDTVTTSNTTAAAQEAAHMVNDASASVDAIWGQQVRDLINNTTVSNDSGDLASARGIGRGIIDTAMCDSAGNCYNITTQDVDGIGQQATNAVSNTANTLITNAQNQTNLIVNSLVSNFVDTAVAGGGLRNTITNIQNAIRGEGQRNFAIQRMYLQVERDIKNLVAPGNVDTWKGVITQTSPVVDIKDISVILVGPKSPNDRKMKVIKRLVAAKRAIEVATQMQALLKRLPVQNIDGRADDAAWKDVARLYYYWVILQNETLKLQSASLQSDAMTVSPDMDGKLSPLDSIISAGGGN